MKSKFLSLIILGVGTSMMTTSCQKFLDQDPKTALTENQVYKDLNLIEPLLGAMYTDWRNCRQDRSGFRFQLGGDESQQGAFQVMTDPDQSGLDKYNGYLSPTNNALTAEWNKRALLVGEAANTIYALQMNTQDESKRTELLAEGYFIWSSVTFDLTVYWGEVPVIDVAKNKELGMGRQPLSVVYSYLVNYLTYAVDHLPETQSDIKRPTKYAALALLGKVYMNAPQESTFKDYQKAADCFNKIIQSGKYALVSNFADLFDPTKPANTVESIYEFQFNNTYPDNNMTQWQMGSRAVAQLDPNHHVGEYCYFGGYDLMVPTKYCYSDVANGGVWETGDTRKNASIRYDFTYQGLTPVVEGWMGQDELDPHVKKYEDIRTDTKTSFWYSGKNIFYLRYSDILLCYAECLNETGHTSDGVAIVNQVRKRGFGGTLPAGMAWNAGMSQDDFRTKILDERMRELCFEGWRRMDVIRLGKFVEYVKARNKWANASGTIQEFHKLYPIPQNEILINSDMSKTDQNPGY